MSKASLGLGYSPLTKKIHIAKFKELGDFTAMRIGSMEPVDVTEKALQIAYQLTIDEGGIIYWERDNGDVMKLSAELVKVDEIPLPKE